MFDGLEKKVIDEFFKNKIEELRKELDKNFLKYGGLDVSILDEIGVLKNIYNKIKKLR
mgnify:CR=1 FL=1